MVKEQDELIKLIRLLEGQDMSRPLPSQILQEMPIFLRHFRPIICAAGYHCLGIKNKDPLAWQHSIFELRIERIDNPPPNARPWACYKVVSARQVSIKSLREEYATSPGSLKGLEENLKQGEIYHKENVKEGSVGTITTFLVCDADGEDRRVISWAGHDEEGWGEGGKDWFGDFVKAVEEGSGRLQAK